ncbi:MAG: glycosyltransferase [Candidatus Micrarchaeota archaeon]|nr:glycosyltransferase [Candidatus Micrarchaeota archaeon]
MMFTIIIPAYNEEKRIGKTLDEFSEFFDGKGIDYEILVIMDGCTDRTPEIVKVKSKKNKNIRFKIYPEKQGKGGALLKGFTLSRGDYVAYTDADGATSPKEMFKLLQMIGDYDGIIGSRWMKGSVLSVKQPLMRRIASRGFNLLTRLILGLPYKDTQCPAKVFKGKVVRDVAKSLVVTDFAIDACILYTVKILGFKVKEVPISWEDKEMSSLKMRKAIPKMFYTVLKVRIKTI